MITNFKLFESRFISQKSKSNLLDFLSQKRTSLKDSTISELSEKDLRDSENITLYRGLLFDRIDKDKIGENFIYKSDKPSSWSKDYNIAERFAKYGYLNTDSNIMANFFVSKRDGLIDGELGIIIKYEFEPKDILVDINKIPNKFNYEYLYENEVIVKPVDIKAEIVKIFTKIGEYTPDEFKELKIDNGYNKLKDFYINSFKDINDKVINLYSGYIDERNKDTKSFYNYIQNNLEHIKNESDYIIRYFNKIYENQPDLNPPQFGSNDEDKKLYNNLKSIRRMLDMFDTTRYIDNPSFRYTNSYYRNIILSEYFDKNIDRMKYESIKKLESKFCEDFNIKDINIFIDKYKYVSFYMDEYIYRSNSIISEIKNI